MKKKKTILDLALWRGYGNLSDGSLVQIERMERIPYSCTYFLELQACGNHYGVVEGTIEHCLLTALAKAKIDPRAEAH